MFLLSLPDAGIKDRPMPPLQSTSFMFINCRLIGFQQFPLCYFWALRTHCSCFHRCWRYSRHFACAETVGFDGIPALSPCTLLSSLCQEGTAMLLEHLAGSLASAIPVSTQLDIAAQHHLFMMGRNGSNVKQIMQRTGAQIHFPDPSNPQKKSTVYLQGTIESVCLARQYLMVRLRESALWPSSLASLNTHRVPTLTLGTCYQRKQFGSPGKQENFLAKGKKK